MDRMEEAWAAGIMAGMVRIIWDSTKGWLCVMVDTIMLRLLGVDIITSQWHHYSNIKNRISSGNKTSREVVVSLVVPAQEAAPSALLTLLNSNSPRSSSIHRRKFHRKVSGQCRMATNLRTRSLPFQVRRKVLEAQREVHRPPEVKLKEKSFRLSWRPSRMP